MNYKIAKDDRFVSQSQLVMFTVCNLENKNIIDTFLWYLSKLTCVAKFTQRRSTHISAHNHRVTATVLVSIFCQYDSFDPVVISKQLFTPIAFFYFLLNNVQTPKHNNWHCFNLYSYIDNLLLGLIRYFK